MIVVTGTIEIDEQDIDRLKQQAIVMIAATRKEPGCHHYAFYQDIEKPGRFRIYEEWESRDALASHFKTPHMKEYREAMSKSKIISRNLVSFERGEAMPL